VPGSQIEIGGFLCFQLAGFRASGFRAINFASLVWWDPRRSGYPGAWSASCLLQGIACGKSSPNGTQAFNQMGHKSTI